MVKLQLTFVKRQLTIVKLQLTEILLTYMAYKVYNNAKERNKADHLYRSTIHSNKIITFTGCFLSKEVHSRK
ncbi:hypothetical protein RF007C_02300 [Ruminococcus flavefaciens 007c]|uniref:Uncharacterized protein n=1 Tax=Ruminococcus flavefaciens 007c TaxID=1341157 RepID=W7UU86_RUMFL|nr:hypothetical protein RF007C_02300 [Ruminococcus flavefaciens 007c]